MEPAPSEYADHIDAVAAFLLHLLGEREKLSRAIRAAKERQEMDMDSEVSLNSTRQSLASFFRHMVDLRNSEKLLPGGATGYRFNAEGNQVPFRCDAKRVVTIHYDRNRVRSYLKQLTEKSDQVSAQLDRCLINSQVDYDAPFDVNDSFAAVFGDYQEAADRLTSQVRLSRMQQRRNAGRPVQVQMNHNAARQLTQEKCYLGRPLYGTHRRPAQRDPSARRFFATTIFPHTQAPPPAPHVSTTDEGI